MVCGIIVIRTSDCIMYRDNILRHVIRKRAEKRELASQQFIDLRSHLRSEAKKGLTFLEIARQECQERVKITKVGHFPEAVMRFSCIKSDRVKFSDTLFLTNTWALATACCMFSISAEQSLLETLNKVYPQHKFTNICISRRLSYQHFVFRLVTLNTVILPQESCRRAKC